MPVDGTSCGGRGEAQGRGGVGASQPNALVYIDFEMPPSRVNAIVHIVGEKVCASGGLSRRSTGKIAHVYVFVVCICCASAYVRPMFA